MAVNFIRLSSPAAQTGTSLTFAITSSTGNVMVVGIVVDSGTGVTSVKDNLNQTYTIDPQNSVSSTAGDCYFAYKFGSQTGVTSIIVTKPSGGCVVFAYDLSSSTGGAKDTINFLSNQSSLNPSITISASLGDFIAAMVAAASTPTGTSGSFTYDPPPDLTFLVHEMAGAHLNNSPAGTQTCTWTISSGAWDALIIAIEEAPPSGNPETNYGFGESDFIWGGGDERGL